MQRIKPLSILLLVCGALSYLILLPEIWWLGLAFAAIAVIAGGATLKKYHMFSVVAMLLAIASCLIYVLKTNISL
ncbi:MAG: hypothetical protein VB082_09190 [Christensenella sp.]|nr:hypothetical protein [Christensenella sp.]